MGGGHLITKDGYDVELLVNTLKYFKEKYQIEIILEPGGAIAWQTGFLKTTIIDIVENQGSPTAIMRCFIHLSYARLLRNALSA